MSCKTILKGMSIGLKCNNRKVDPFVVQMGSDDDLYSCHCMTSASNVTTYCTLNI